LLGVFERISRSKLIPHRAARREMELELKRGQAAAAELQLAYVSLEKKIEQHAIELGKANEDLREQITRCRNAEARFIAISESVPYGAWVYRMDGTAEQISNLYLNLIGTDFDTAKKTPWFSFVHEEDRARVEQQWKNAIKKSKPWDNEFRVTDPNGDVHYLLSRGAALEEDGGEARFYAGFQLDVTDRVKLRDELVRLKDHLERQVEEKTQELREANGLLLSDLADHIKTEVALRDSESQLRAVFENALDAMLLLDDSRRVLDANGSAQELFGYGPGELRTMRWDKLIPANRIPEVDENWQRLMDEGTKRGEIEVLRANGCTRLVSFSSRANIRPGKHLITLRDITDHRVAEDSLRSLSQRLVRLQDDERRRIARELHDSIGQYLAALGMHLDVIVGASDRLPERARKSATEAVEICRNSSADIRTISYLLHPPLLDEVGLVPALEWYVSGFSERSGVTVTCEIGDIGKSLPKELNTTLFRIIQEALANIHKHASSKDAKIRLRGDDEEVVLEISDSGIGIDPERLRNGRDGANGFGVGITGMRERVRQLRGTLEIESANPGTLIRATLPVVKESNNGNT
jgi:PAS domain S-box-containing protein